MATDRPALEILGDLNRFFESMLRDAPPAIPPGRTLANLSTIVSKISQPKIARAVKCPADYISLWKSVASSDGYELPNRAIRYLSWETDIAIQPSFQVLALRPERFSVRSIQGIMRSVHRRWRTTHGTQSIHCLRLALAGYSGRNPLLEKWKANLDFLLSNEGPIMLARDLIREKSTWEAKADEWGIEADTEFGQSVLEATVQHSLYATRAVSETLQSVVVEYMLPSHHWTAAGFKTAVSQLLLACSSQTSQSHQELLKRSLTEDPRLLDPRVPANFPNWAGVNVEAQKVLIQWLSAFDIKLFFDHVLPTRNDPHGRKTFWLKYTKSVIRSRPLLAYPDEMRWLAGSETRRNRNYGRMASTDDTSAFLLDFGRILIIEFSKVGNAVYVYEHRDVPELIDRFWSDSRFLIHNLKQQASCIQKISHIKNWQLEMRTLLAQYGIHPGA